MRITVGYAYLVFIIGLISCSTRFNPEEIEIEITTMLNDYHGAIKTSGLKAEFDYLDSSEQFFWVPPGYHTALDYDSVRTILLQNAPGISEMDLKWEKLNVFPLTADMATYYGIVNSIVTDISGNVSETRMLESGTLIRRKDGWKLLSGQSRILGSE